MSPVLLNAVSEDIFRELKEAWRVRGAGVKMNVGDSDRLTNLRFADDVLLIANGLEELKGMLADLVAVAEAHGLDLHPAKPKSLAMLNSGVAKRTERMPKLKA